MERPIEAITTVHASPERAARVLMDDPGSVFADHCTPAERRAGRFRTALSVDVGAGATLRQEVEITLAPPHNDLNGDSGVFLLPMQWQPVGNERLAPSFTGTLDVSADRQGARLELRGTYTIPLGPAGRFGDGVVGQRLARRSFAAYLTEVAARLDAEVTRHLDARRFHPVLANMPDMRAC